MKSYKCEYCNLTNWIDVVVCKRCQMPNSHLLEHEGINDNVSADEPIEPPATVNQFDKNQPPPPNVYGERAGTTNQVVTDNSQMSQRLYEQNSTLSAAEVDEFALAKGRIKSAWVCGAVVCAISTIFAAVMVALSKDSEIASPIDVMISVVIFGGLTIGVYYKNRACAVLLCGVFVLDKIITWASTGRFSGIIIAVIFVYYMIYGIQGTFTYHRLMKKMG